MDKPVVKSNKLILARFKMTTYEQKIILLCISKIDRHAKRTGIERLNDDLFFELNAKEISDFLNINPRTLYKDLDVISSKLMRYQIDIKDDDNESFEKIRPFPYSKYELGKFYLRIEQSMEKYLLELKERFTIYDINNIRMLSSNYSLRIYEILKSCEWINEYIFDISELKQIIGVQTLKDGKVENDLYARYYDFKKRVLLVAQEELSEKTDISFTFEEIKKGRKVEKIKFYIASKSKMCPEETDLDDLIDQIRDIIKEPLKIRDYKAILQAANNDLRLVKDKYQLALKQKGIENLVGWMIRAIEDSYSSIGVENDLFNDIPQRNYKKDDYDKLEKQLLNLE